MEIEKLVGAEAFIDGYVSQRDGTMILDIKLIETKTGTIGWAQTAQRRLR